MLLLFVAVSEEERQQPLVQEEQQEVMIVDAVISHVSLLGQQTESFANSNKALFNPTV